MYRKRDRNKEMETEQKSMLWIFFLGQSGEFEKIKESKVNFVIINFGIQ